MASLTLITLVLAIITRTCFGGHPKHGVVYVPVCTPECYKQSHFTGCPDKVPHIGNLPLQEHGQTYHPQLDLGVQHLQEQHGGGHGYRGSHLQEQGHHGSATVYQQNDHHSSQLSQSVHHGSGTSQQSFRQEYHGLANHDLDHGHDHDHDHDHHHKKNAYYKFEYSVNDHKTGDVKRHREERKGDEVNGEYSLLEEDGNVRTVKYFADWKSGFHAQVHNTKPHVG